MLEFNFKDITIETLQNYKNEIQSSLKQTIGEITSLGSKSETQTFNNTIQPLITVQTLNEPKKNIYDYVKNFYTNRELRDTATELSKEIDKFLIDIYQNKEFYQAVNNYYLNIFQKENLTHEEKRYVEHMMRDFRRMGMHLDDGELEEVKAMKKELSDLCSEFSKNLNDENTSFVFTKWEIDGMPDSWFSDTKIVRDEDGKKSRPSADDDVKYRMTLKYPDYIPCMEYVRNERVRKTMWEAFSNRCGSENSELLRKVVILRYKIAKILGYQNHADYATEIKIIKTGQKALDFENEMSQRFNPIYEKDMEELFEFAQQYQDTPLNKDQLDPWDLPLYMRLYTEHKYQVDMEKIKEYFPMDKVRTGLFEIYQLILGVKFSEIETDNKWHDSVKLFQVNDSKSDDILGYFYLDMYPREGKFGHAAAFNFMASCDMSKINGNGNGNETNLRRPNIICMACNFPEDGCISFDDVVTFFHEFGHVMHFICSKPQLADYNGFEIEWDFVEAPSQMLENWCYCEKSLKKMSAHKETGEPVPSDLVQRIKAMKNALCGRFYKRQLVIGMFDLAIHTMKFDKPEEENFNLQDIWYQVYDKVAYKEKTDTRWFPYSGIGHYVGGYDAGYYGYLLSETYAANMFHKFFAEDELNVEAGMRYRKLLLEPGSTKDGIDLLKEFLGEDTDLSYFLKEKGLISG